MEGNGKIENYFGACNVTLRHDVGERAFLYGGVGAGIARSRCSYDLNTRVTVTIPPAAAVTVDVPSGGLSSAVFTRKFSLGRKRRCGCIGSRLVGEAGYCSRRRDWVGVSVLETTGIREFQRRLRNKLASLRCPLLFFRIVF